MRGGEENGKGKSRKKEGREKGGNQSREQRKMITRGVRGRNRGRRR